MNFLFQDLNFNIWYDRLFYDLDKSGILLRKAKIYTETSQADLEISNLSYELTADAVNRALVLAQIHLPLSIKNINVTINENGMRVKTLSGARSNDSAFNSKTRNEMISILNPRKIDDPTHETSFRVPHIHFNADLSSRFQLFDPARPAKHQVFLKVTSILTLGDDLNLVGVYALDLNNNFDVKISS